MSVSLVVCAASHAYAQDTVDSITDPRAVGRAGTTTVSGDSGMTLLTNPGGMVRRSGARLLLSASLGAVDTTYEAAGSTLSPVIVNRSANAATPMIAYHQGNEEGTWVLGALFIVRNSEISMPTPSFGQPKDDVARLFPHRYGGTQWQRESRRLGVGGAIRIGESIGLGASASLGQVRLSESRRLWGGFAGRDELLDSDLDLALTLTGQDSYNPGASLGALVAPPEIPLEFALAAEFRRGQEFRSGPLALEATSINNAPQPLLSVARGSLRLASNYDLRTGIRYLGERVFVEVGAELGYVRSDKARSWSIEGVEVADRISGLRREVTHVGALVSQRTRMAFRGAVDYEALPGFLWVTGGYAYQSPGSSRSRHNPGFARLGGHTVAIGLESAFEDFLITLGYARHIERSRSVTAGTSGIDVVNPFDSGPAPANAGRYRQSSDQLGFAVEIGFR
jgi:hypothetical protein